MPFIHLTHDAGPTPTGSRGARYGSFAAVYKVHDPREPYAIANEFIGSRIAHLLGIPTPAPGISHVRVGSSVHKVFCSTRFGFANGADPTPIIAADVLAAEPHYAHGLVVLDTLIANADRNPTNLAMAPMRTRETGPSRLVAFDHGLCMMGGRGDLSRLKAITTELGIGLEHAGKAPLPDSRSASPHCIAERINDLTHLDAWIDRAETIPCWMFEDIGRECVGYGLLTPDESSYALGWLIDRSRQLRLLFRQRESDFPSLRQSPLTLTPNPR